MKKLMLSVLVVLGLAGAQIQAGFGAKAWTGAKMVGGFLNKATWPVLGLGALYEAETMKSTFTTINQNAESVAPKIIAKFDALDSRLGNFEKIGLTTLGIGKQVLEAPMVAKFLDSQKVPETWFGNHLLDGKLWYGAKWLNAGVIATAATIQTYLGILHIYQQMKQAMVAQQPQAERQPTLEEINEYIAEQRAVQEQQRRQAAAVNPRPGHAGRSRIVTRR